MIPNPFVVFSTNPRTFFLGPLAHALRAGTCPGCERILPRSL